MSDASKPKPGRPRIHPADAPKCRRCNRPCKAGLCEICKPKEIQRKRAARAKATQEQRDKEAARKRTARQKDKQSGS